MPGTRPGIPYLVRQFDGGAVSCSLGSAASAAYRPRVDALRVQHVLGYPDLLLTAGTTRGARTTVGVPGAGRELQAAGVTVTGVDPPVATRLARRDRVPVHAVGLVDRGGIDWRRVRVRRRRNICVKAHRGRRRGAA